MNRIIHESRAYIQQDGMILLILFLLLGLNLLFGFLPSIIYPIVSPIIAILVLQIVLYQFNKQRGLKTIHAIAAAPIIAQWELSLDEWDAFAANPAIRTFVDGQANRWSRPLRTNAIIISLAMTVIIALVLRASDVFLRLMAGLIVGTATFILLARSASRTQRSLATPYPIKEGDLNHTIIISEQGIILGESAFTFHQPNLVIEPVAYDSTYHSVRMPLRYSLGKNRIIGYDLLIPLGAAQADTVAEMVDALNRVVSRPA